MGYIEAHQDIVPVKICRYLSPLLRRSIVWGARLRRRMKTDKLDDDQYALIAQWIPRTVAEKLTGEEAKELVAKLEEHKKAHQSVDGQ